MAIVVSYAEGIIKNKDSNLLASNGGHVVLTKYWGKNLLSHKLWALSSEEPAWKQRCQSRTSKKWKLCFWSTSKRLLSLRKSHLIWFSTGIKWVSTTHRTMEKEGAKRVEIAGVDDKRQITAVFAGSQTGDFLPPQLIYKVLLSVAYQLSHFLLTGTLRLVKIIGRKRAWWKCTLRRLSCRTLVKTWTIEAQCKLPGSSNLQ